MVRRGRGDTERERASFIRYSNTVFGVLVSHWTVTPGSAPPARTDDAVSSIVASVALGELIVTDFTDPDGEDMSHNSFLVKFSNHSHSNNCLRLGHPSWLAQLLVVLKESLNLHPVSFVSPTYHIKLPILVSFKIWVFLTVLLDPA